MAERQSLFNLALCCLEQSDLQIKIDLTNNVYQLWQKKLLFIDKLDAVKQILSPGRPENPVLVQPKHVPRRKLHTIEGKAALIHAICHIEFNAINLAWDAVYRFQDMPIAYYSDWVQIAFEEAKHFCLLNNYLLELGYAYGDFPAHNSLWELAVNTDYDILARMALVPRIMEARGLDVTPGIINKFANIGDNRAVDILNIILQEEQGHVAAGNKWFHYLCMQRKLEPLECFSQLIKKHIKGQIKPPFATEYRLASGFTIKELEMLENITNEKYS